MTSFLSDNTFEEWINHSYFHPRSWTDLAAHLLYQGNCLIYSEWVVSAFKALSPTLYPYVWLFANRDKSAEVILRPADGVIKLQSIFDDPSAWTANEVSLPDVYNAYASLVNQMDEGVVFRAENGEVDYCGGQTYTDTLWHCKLQYLHHMIHVDETCDHPGVHEKEEDFWDGSHEETHYVRFIGEPLRDHLFRLHASHSLLTFKPIDLSESTRQLHESIAARRIEEEENLA